MPARTRTRRRAPTVTPQGEALNELLIELAFTYFRLNAAGKRLMRSHGVTPGKVSMLRSLAREGEQTVPEIARARPVPRQPVQRMADELAAAGLVEFVANERHARSRLLRITPRGEKVLAGLERAQAGWASALAGDDLPERGLRSATALLRRIRNRLQATEPPEA